MIDAVLFDMDGVLIDSEPVHMVALRSTLGAHGLPVPSEADWEPIFLGRPDRDGLRDWFRMHAVDPPVEPLMAHKLEYFARYFDELVAPFEDGQWLARELHARGIRLALVSGARRPEVDLTLKRFELESVFQASISSDDVPRGKPDPAPYLRGAEVLGVSAAACVVIEDAVVGVQAARAAGARVVAVDRLGRPERFDGATTFPRLDERALEAILRLG